MKSLGADQKTSETQFPIDSVGLHLLSHFKLSSVPISHLKVFIPTSAQLNQYSVTFPGPLDCTSSAPSVVVTREKIQMSFSAELNGY